MSIPTLYSQSNNLTNSPYSLFGLGVQSNSNTGRNSALGRGGIALESESLINTLNPASFTAIAKEHFLFDIGFTGEFNSVSTSANSEKQLSVNFSNMALAFSINEKSGIGLSLVPFTDVGYSLTDIKSNIEGSQDEFVNHITGSGGLNNLSVQYGYKLFDNLSVGFETSLLFGAINQTENITLEETFLNLTEENYYKGFRFGLGMQYKIDSKYTIGFTSSLPTLLKGSKDRLVSKSLDLIDVDVENESDINIQDFELPFEIGFGLSAKFLNGLNINMDLKSNLWGLTGQSDPIGDYINQSIFSLGVQYKAEENSLKYWRNIEFRAGLNYDSGYLKVLDQAIDNYSFTAGVGLPIGSRMLSMVNISYSRGQRGRVTGVLIGERFNLININISLRDIWFQKIKFK